jgi:single-stranded DNA-binding protein
MKGIESAFVATTGEDVELKTSKSGKLYANFSAVVIVGTGEDGKDVSQWLRIGCFGDVAEQLAAQTRKGDRVYAEGSLTLNTWQNSDGETKRGLSVAAWKCERLGNIGRNRARLTCAPDEDAPEPPSPSLPIAFPAHKRPKGWFGKPKKASAPGDEPAPFNDPCHFKEK